MFSVVVVVAGPNRSANKYFCPARSQTGNKAENPITVGLIIRKEEGGGRREEGGFITTSARNVFVNIVQIFKSNIIVTF